MEREATEEERWGSLYLTCPHAVSYKRADVSKNTCSQYPFATSSEHLYNSEHLSESKVYRTYYMLLYLCPHRRTENHRDQCQRECLKFDSHGHRRGTGPGYLSRSLKFSSQGVQAITPLRRHSKLHQGNATRKRKGIQPPPLILKLVNNYLGGISYVLILVGL